MKEEGLEMPGKSAGCCRMCPKCRTSEDENCQALSPQIIEEVREKELAGVREARAKEGEGEIEDVSKEESGGW